MSSARPNSPRMAPPTRPSRFAFPLLVIPSRIGLEANSVIAWPQQRQRLVNAAIGEPLCPDGISLQTVTTVPDAFQLVGFFLLVIAAGLAGVVALSASQRHLAGMAGRRRVSFVEPVFRDPLCRRDCRCCLVGEVVAYGYGLRQGSLIAAAEQAGADRIKRLVAETKPRPVAESSSRYLKENSELRIKLDQTRENKTCRAPAKADGKAAVARPEEVSYRGAEAVCRPEFRLPRALATTRA